MSSFGPVHTLTVYKVGDPGEFYTNEFEDYEVEHTPECKLVTRSMSGVDGTSSESWQEYDCAVQYEIGMCGLRWLLKYSGCPVTEPGTYRIQAWSETIRYFEGTEHDGGIGLIQEMESTG